MRLPCIELIHNTPDDCIGNYNKLICLNDEKNEARKIWEIATEMVIIMKMKRL